MCDHVWQIIYRFVNISSDFGIVVTFADFHVLGTVDVVKLSRLLRKL